MSDSEVDSVGQSEHDSDLGCGQAKAPAMTPNEKQLLLDLVDEYKTVLESKKTDFGTTSKKADAWQTVTERFCSSPGATRRTASQLKTWWNNCKKRAKKNVFIQYFTNLIPLTFSSLLRWQRADAP